MERKTIDYFIRNDKDRELADRADRLAGIIAKKAPRHDVEGSFPFDSFAELKEAGYLKLTVPEQFGGDGISLYQLVMVQERLARGDGSTTLGVGWHLGLMLHLRTTHQWPERLFEEFCQDVVEKGAMINSFASERATGSPSRGGKPQTRAEKTDGGWLITGRKTFSTLSPILDRFLVRAELAGEDKVGEFIVRKSDRVSIDETWDTLGMRATGSHDVVLDRAFAPDEALLGVTTVGNKPQYQDDGNGWMLHIPACYIGLAYAARDFAVDFARNYRPNSLPGPISELPHIQQRIGQMEIDLMTARTLLYSVAERWDRCEDERADLKPELGLAKYVATNWAIQIVDEAMRIVGGASLSRSLPLERIYRDVRAGLHNPPMDDAVIRGLSLRALRE